MSKQRLIGQTIGKYKIVDILGRGGMAEVYKAYQETLDRHVAIKLMHSFLADEEDFLSRFRREARAMAALSHSNIVSVYDFDVQDGTYYIVMEYVSGGTLKQKLELMANQEDRLPLAHTVQIVLEMSDALAYAHSRGMVHRDIKPANIMINDQGRAILTDFGIAKILSGPSFTATGAMIGTPAYMSPEQGLGQPGDERSDLYALGVLFFQMATGRLPYDADTPLAVILKHVNDPIPPPSSLNEDIPRPIHEVIIKSMAKNPEERYQTANDLARELRAAVRVNDLELAAMIPSGLLQDRPTPPPMQTVQSAAPGGLSATIVSPGAAGKAQPTRIGGANRIGETEVSAPPAPPSGRRRGLVIAAALIFLFLIAGIAGGIVLANRGNGEATATALPLVSAATDTPESADDTPTPSTLPVAQETADIGATAAAAVAAALTAVPTDTPLPTSTILPSATPTPDVTATFLASCTEEIELVNFYTFQNEQSQSAPANANFTMNWVLMNSGTCPLSAGMEWVYVEGEDFSEEGPVALNETLLSEEEVTVSSTFSAPAQPGSYESTWQLVDADGEPVGSAFSFEITVYVSASPTPVPPTPTVGPTATPTVLATTELDFNFSVSGCEYLGDEWRCQVTFNPFGGVGPYTLWVFDAAQPAEYRGNGPFNHFVQARRCFPWINNVRLQDDGTGQSFSRDVFISPDSYFPGGCTEPS
jgi:serine/threonine-protein kinase